MHDGLVVVDKPSGFTSHDIVAKLRKAYGQKRVGHAGTLDPDATGVLLVGLGRVTRLLRYLQETTKVYRGTVSFGVATDTLDAAGAILERRPMPVTESAVRDAMLRFVGDLQQVPPMVSALRVGGRRLHELARAGEEVERKPRSIRIDTFTLESFEPGPVSPSHRAGRVLVRHLHPLARRRPRRGARWARASRGATPAGRGLVHQRGVASTRRDRGGSRRGQAHPARRDAGPGADPGRRRVGPSGRARLGLPERGVRGRRPGTVRRHRRSRARCSRCTSAAAPR